MKNQMDIDILRGERFFPKPLFPFHMEQYLITKENHIAPHTHDFFELVYVVEGDAVHHIEDQRYKLVAGNVFVLEPDVCHRFSASPSRDTIVYNVLFSREFLKEELSSLSYIPSFVNFFYLIPFLRKSSSFIPYLPLHSVQKVQIEQHLNVIYHEYQAKDDGFQLIIKTRLIEVLVLLSRYYTENQGKQHIQMSDEETIASITQFLSEHSDQPITLAQLSQLYGMSISSLTAKFKTYTGRTLVEYRHFAQVQRACTELHNSNKKISAIALDCGFNDISHFNRIFKKHVGFTPREYRTET